MKRVVVAVAVVSLARLVSATPITTCGQTVADHDTGALTGDLDCSAAPAGTAGVVLSNHAVLDMNGHTLVAPPYLDGVGGVGVDCAVGAVGRCTVTSSSGVGTIVTTVSGGISTSHHATVQNLTIDGGSYGIFALGNVTLKTVTVRHASITGVRGKNVTATNAVASENGEKGFDVGWTGSAPGYKILGGVMRGTIVDASANGWEGIYAGRRCAITGLTAIGNGTSTSPVSSGAGVRSKRVILTNSTVTDNDGGTFPDVDVASFLLPVLTSTTCGHSANPSGGFATWGVCAGD